MLEWVNDETRLEQGWRARGWHGEWDSSDSVRERGEEFDFLGGVR